MKKLFLISFAMILLFGFVSAVPPPQINVNIDVGLDVSFPKINTLEQGKDFNFNFHVYNRTTGARLDNTTTTCFIDVVANDGTHLIENLPLNSGSEFKGVVKGGNFSRLGNYAFITDCNTTSYGGFASYGIEVTGTGLDFTNARSLFFIGLLFIFAFLFVVIIAGISLLPSRDSTNEKGDLMSINNLKHVRSVLYVVGYLLLMSIVFLSSNVALAYLGTKLFGDILFVIFQIMFGLAIPMFLIWLMFILKQIFRDMEVKKMIERGVWGNEP